MNRLDRQAFSKAEVASLLGISLATVERMIGRKELRAVRLGQRRIIIPHDELDRLLASGKTRSRSVRSWVNRVGEKST